MEPPFSNYTIKYTVTYKYLFSSMKKTLNLHSCVVNNQLVGVVSIEILQSMPYPRDQVVVA